MHIPAWRYHSTSWLCAAASLPLSDGVIPHFFSCVEGLSAAIVTRRRTQPLTPFHISGLRQTLIGTRSVHTLKEQQVPRDESTRIGFGRLFLQLRSTVLLRLW